MSTFQGQGPELAQSKADWGWGWGSPVATELQNGEEWPRIAHLGELRVLLSGAQDNLNYF